MRKGLIIPLLITLLTSVWVIHTFAGVTGKIAGTVKDAKTGEPLPLANVTIVGTTFGAATDEKGFYFIINIPPGKYSVRAQMMGYQVVIKEDIFVRTDLTTTVNFSLQPTVIELEEVVVTAERPLVRPDVTAKMAIIGREQIEVMPIEDFKEALKIQAGFTDQVHLRGGRGNEVAYMIDGMLVTNPLAENSGAGLILDRDSVQEMMVLAGTFNAEYGSALSGIVNVVTRDPTPKLQGKLEYLSPWVNGSPWRRKNGTGVPDRNPAGLTYKPWTLKDDFRDWPFGSWEKNLMGQFRGNISGAVPFVKNVTFFLSGRYLNENSPYPFGYDLRREAMEKLVWKPSPNIKLSLMGQQTRRYWQPYNHDWKYRPDHYSHFQRFRDQFSVIFTHTLSHKTFYTLRSSRSETFFERKVPGKVLVINTQDWPDFHPDTTSYERPIRWEAREFYYTGDDDAGYQKDETITWEIKADMTSQITKTHLVKAGIDLLEYKIDRLVYKEPYKIGTHEYQKYIRRPVEGAAYVQDKIEYDFVILNLGFRLDLFAPNGFFRGNRETSGSFPAGEYLYDDETATMWPDIYEPGYVDKDGTFHYNEEEKAPAYWKISPRLGVAFPITDKLVFHGAYGHFYQRPNYRDIFYFHDIRRTRSHSIVGNPKAKPQKTITFEVGLKYQIAADYAADVTAYYRDIYDLLGSMWTAFYPYNYAVINNSNYANAKGFEVSIEKRYSNYFSGSLNYTFLIARGNEDESRKAARVYWSSTNNRLRPRRDFYLGWDRRHTFGINVDFRIPQNRGPQLFGRRIFANSGINFLIQMQSGLPYTPTERAEGEWGYWLNILQTNTGRRPWTARVDVQANKDFKLMGYRASVFVKITNLFDRRNVQWVYTNTGLVWDRGPTYAYISQDYQRDPTAYDEPRQIRFGVRFLW